MQKQVYFDYFYGGESELFSYYRIPRLLVTGEQFKDLSTDAKLLYGLLLDRTQSHFLLKTVAFCNIMLESTAKIR